MYMQLTKCVVFSTKPAVDPVTWDWNLSRLAQDNWYCNCSYYSCCHLKKNAEAPPASMLIRQHTSQRGRETMTAGEAREGAFLPCPQRPWTPAHRTSYIFLKMTASIDRLSLLDSYRHEVAASPLLSHSYCWLGFWLVWLYKDQILLCTLPVLFCTVTVSFIVFRGLCFWAKPDISW